MKKTILTVVAAGLLALLTSDAAQAAGRWRRGRATRVNVQPTARRALRNDAPYQQYRRYQWVYPRYIGGFHYRDLQHLGMPTGDRGFRGTPW